MTSRKAPGGLLAPALLAAAACSSNSATGADSDPGLQVAENSGIVFLTQNVVPQVMMDALYMGRVVRAEDGCLRLDTRDAPTAVWPKGYGASVAGESVQVLNEVGEPVGTIGEEFDLPGGEVPELSNAMGFDQDDRDRATSRCPGRYWIVGLIGDGEAD